MSTQMLMSVIAQYLQACEAGAPLDRRQLLEQYPELAGTLSAFFEDHDRMLSGRKPQSIAPSLAGATAEPLTHTVVWRPQPEAASSVDSSHSRSVPRVPVSEQGLSGLKYVGDYELVEEISRGGMGVVYKALDLKLNRCVALKMILAGEMAGPEEVWRFYAEAEAASQLDHPGIVPIYQIGQHAGLHYYSMGLVEGPSLAELLNTGPLSPTQAAQLLIKIAKAVDYANARGVIHRDLKPANILMDAYGNPKITDFGIAKRLEGNNQLTRSGQILGTPNYMPPEQAAGRTQEIGCTADVYSLGAILYATLTGQPPFQADSLVETLMYVLEGEPTLPSQHQSGIPRALESICMKCLEKSPDKRYATAGELANDLRRFLDGEPIAARAASIWQRLRRWSRREPALVAHLLGLSLILMTVQSTYLLIGTDIVYYLQHTLTLLAWMVGVLLLQQLVNRPRYSERAAMAWCILDALCMTTILVLAEPPVGQLLSGYALLIVACGFLLKTSVVVTTTITVLGCYVFLLTRSIELRQSPHYCVMFALLIAVLGGIVAMQVRRITRLNRHFEQG